jgi:hypothetical protein
LEVRNNQKIEPSYHYHSPIVEDTYITETSDGYQILLYNYGFCGCSPHITSNSIVTVKRDGTIILGTFKDIYASNDGLCVD